MNDQLYITVQLQLVDFMKTLPVNLNSYQGKKIFQFFDDLMELPLYSVKFSDQKFRKLLFFPIVNAIQQTKNGPWHTKISVAEHLVKGDYLFHFPPSLFFYTNTINFQVKLSIIRSYFLDYEMFWFNSFIKCTKINYFIQKLRVFSYNLLKINKYNL